MIVTIANLSATDPVYVSCLNKTLVVGESIAVYRDHSDLDREDQLKDLLTAGSISMAFVKEARDAINVGFSHKLQVYTNTTRPAATLFEAGSMIWNSSDNAPNFSDGTSWYDAIGDLT